MDELIAWTQIPIPQNVMNGETYEDWFPLSGKQGDGMEGMVNLVLSFTVSIYNFKNTLSASIFYFVQSTITKNNNIRFFSLLHMVFIQQSAQSASLA